MKKLLLLLAILPTLVACAQNEKKANKDQMMGTSKTLVAYFSATGTTEAVAKKLAKTADATLYEIKPEKKYTTADLDWTDKQSRSTLEMKDKNSRPAIVKDLKDVDNYTTVYIGFPIWWYTAPTIINTFIESYNLKGKTIVLFATSGGSNADKALKDLKTTYPELNFKAAKLLNSASESSLKEWVEAFK